MIFSTLSHILCRHHSTPSVIFTTVLEVGTIPICILQMRKWRLREVKRGQGICPRWERGLDFEYEFVFKVQFFLIYSFPASPILKNSLEMGSSQKGYLSSEGLRKPCSHRALYSGHCLACSFKPRPDFWLCLFRKLPSSILNLLVHRSGIWH